MSEIKEVKIECKSCKTDFFWKIGDTDERCPRCQLMWGQDIDKVLVEMRKQNFAGQEHAIHVLKLMSNKIAALEEMFLEFAGSDTAAKLNLLDQRVADIEGDMAISAAMPEGDSVNAGTN